jgi:hypothetical protein
MDKRKKRIFIVKIRITNPCWDYKQDQIFHIPIISNNWRNAMETFQNRHCGSEYPLYDIESVEDTLHSGFFMSNIETPDLLPY